MRNFTKKVRPKGLDQSLFLVTLLLVGLGLIVLYSAGYATAQSKESMKYDPYYYIKNQAMYAGLGVIAMYFISKIDYHIYKKFTWLIYGGTMVLMILTPFIGTEVKGAKRWLFGFQPSEIAKFALILVFAALMSKMGKKRMKTFRWGFCLYMAILASFVATLVLQKHLSAIVILSVTAGMMMFVAGTRVLYLATLVIMGVAGGVGYILMNPYAMARVKVWHDPFSEFRGSGWQASQSWIAIGSGGLWGLGLGQGRQKYLYLPEPANDFIFSVACEELGFIGALFILLIFAVFIIKGYFVAVKARDKFGTLLATGITTQIAVQVIMNICVVSGIIPVTGVSLPFFSHGGTSLMMLLGEVGILLSISRQQTEEEELEEQ